MPFRQKRILLRGLWVGSVAIASLAMGCGHAVPNLGLAGLAGTIYAAQAPGNEIEQVYYLGAFDPQEQVPPTVYRLTVRGQSSGISNMKFGSGWVQANLIDSLNTHVGFDANSGRPAVTTGTGEPLSALQTGRRMMMFGPEGFREAPKDHRLVIVMGASPEKFFAAIDEGLGAITQVQREQSTSQVSAQLFKALSTIQAERKRLDDLNKDVAQDIPTTTADAKGGKQ